MRATSAQVATRLLLGAVAFVGIAHIAFLPPWEGYDEYAHYSSIQQFADTGTIPLLRRDRISANIDTYNGPMPYESGSDSAFDSTGRETYRSFRQRGALKLAETQLQFQPGKGLNWEAQQPPLFYILLAPIYELTKHLDLISHLFVLRFTAWTIAFVGFVIGVVSTVHITGMQKSITGPIMAGFPLLVPEFFPEMARLGNDSLCLLLMSIAWAISLHMTSGKARAIHAVYLGIVLGLGLLTKAFFLPITLGICALIVTRGPSTPFRIRQLALVCFFSFVFGGWWYIRNFLVFGSSLGVNDFLQASGVSFWHGLIANFSLFGFFEGIARLILTFSWAGTWSLARLPEPLVLIPLILVALTVITWLINLRTSKLNALAPLFFVIPFVLSLVGHLIYWLALTGRTITPGWYLHIAAAPIAFSMALGWKMPRLCAWLSVSSVLTGIVAWSLQLSLFSGCATKTGTIKYYSFAGSDCFIDFSVLNALGLPRLAIFSLSLAALCAIAAFMLIRGLPDVETLQTADER